MKEFKRAQDFLKCYMLIVFIIEFVAFAYNLNGRAPINSIIYIVFMVFAFVGYVFAKYGLKSAGTICIGFAIISMSTIIYFDILDFLIGIVILLSSIKYNSSFKTNKTEERIKEEIPVKKVVRKKSNAKKNTLKEETSKKQLLRKKHLLKRL